MTRQLSNLGANECDRVTAIASQLTVTVSLMEQSSVTTIVPVSNCKRTRTGGRMRHLAPFLSLLSLSLSWFWLWCPSLTWTDRSIREREKKEKEKEKERNEDTPSQMPWTTRGPFTRG